MELIYEMEGNVIVDIMNYSPGEESPDIIGSIQATGYGAVLHRKCKAFRQYILLVLIYQLVPR